MNIGIFDTTGQEMYKVWKIVNRIKVEGIILIYLVDEMILFIHQWMVNIKRIAKQNISILLVANKDDR